MKISPLVARLNGEDAKDVLMRFAVHQSGMLLCQDGHTRFFIGTKQYEMQKGDMLLIVPFTNVVFTHISADFMGTLCIVDLEFVSAVITPVDLSANIQFVTLHPLSHPSEADTASLLSLIGLIEQRSKDVGKYQLAEKTVDHLLYALAYLIIDSYLSVNHGEGRCSTAKESIMMAFQAHLSRDYATHRNVSHYAGLQNLTTRYFSTCIKMISGYTPLYWINSAVAAEAKRLIHDTNMSIKEIAYQLNFASPTFFTKWYRQFTGETPSQYRARCRVALAHHP